MNIFHVFEAVIFLPMESGVFTACLMLFKFAEKKFGTIPLRTVRLYCGYREGSHVVVQQAAERRNVGRPDGVQVFGC